MPLYRLYQKESFLNKIAEFICTNFKDKFDTVKVILPNGYHCSFLQEVIINKLGTSILPMIIPIAKVSLEGEETFNIPSEEIGKISTLEERMILAQIINSYEKLNYNNAKSLDLSSSLAKLFYEFEANNIELSALKNIPTLDQAEHWHFIYDFLEFAYLNWQKKIIELKKLSPAQYQKIIFNAELGRVKRNNCSLIIAGVIGNNQITHDFIGEISKLPNSHIILPPLPPVDVSPLTFKPEDPLYNIVKIAPTLTATPYLDIPRITILDNLLVNASCLKEAKYDQSPVLNLYEYLEFDHILQEAEYIANQCFLQLQENAHIQIAILITNNKVKNYFTAKLIKYGLSFSDLIGENILTLPITTLLIEIAENIAKEFILKNFISLMLHPLVISKERLELKRVIAKENRFAKSVEEVAPYAQKNSNQTIPISLIEMMSNCEPSLSLTVLLAKIIQISAELAPGLWQRAEAKAIALTIDEIMKIDYQLDEIENLPEILKALLSGGWILNGNSKNSNITICSPNDVTLMNYDLLIYTNFAEGAYPLPNANNPWLNNQMIQHLALDSWAARFGNTMYDFYLNLHNKKVLITRAIKNESSRPSLPSPFLLKLKHILGQKLVSTYFQDKSLSTIANNREALSTFATSHHFPAQISVTDIETLIRAPYNFYAKKILNLKPEPEIEEDPKLSEFGNIFHKIVELYTKNYLPDGGKALKDYARELLFTYTFPEASKKFWQLKIEALEKDFILFDERRREGAKKIFSEIRGELELVIAGHQVKIVSIADRIELNKQNKATILDYKTGSIPTKKDVLSGLSPQLMIEAIILLEGGFADIGCGVETTSLVYVKIGSGEPFITECEISVTREDILVYKRWLISILTYYVTSGQYEIEPNSMKYDDYWHLARRG